MHTYTVLDPDSMAARKEEFFSFVRSRRLVWFNEDGSYRPGTEPDRRITFWALPAFLSASSAEEREWACRWYAAQDCWKGYNVFISSSVAVNLVRERNLLSPELIHRSEEHLDRFTCVHDSKQPCAGINDYMFQGYNDNMPAMAVRQLILAGDVLGRNEFTDRGLFHLQGLCAHLQRRGLLSEHTSGTYLPITLTCLMDIAECTQNREAAEMALACAQRVLLDLFGHFHTGTGTLAGAQSRAYTVDLTASLSTVNGLLWYLTGNPLLIDPTTALGDKPFAGPIHHGGSKPFTAASYVEVFAPSYHLLSNDLLAYLRTDRPIDYTIRATSDYAASPNGCGNTVTTAFHRPLWHLASTETGPGWSGHKTCLQGGLATSRQPASWQDRVQFWEYLGTEQDFGGPNREYPHTIVETDCAPDVGEFHTLQAKGTALSAGMISKKLYGTEVSSLRYGIIFSTFLRQPDELFEDDTPLPVWEGESAASCWQFLRFADVYVGLRAVATVPAANTHTNSEAFVTGRRVIRNRYLRFELPLLQDHEQIIDEAFCKRTDFGCIIEIADRAECGSFAAFRTQCMRGTWQHYHWNGSRHCRYAGRHGELYIADSYAHGGIKAMTIDGVVHNPPPLIEATGLSPRLVPLFPDGRRVRQPHLLYDVDDAGSPYQRRQQGAAGKAVDGMVLVRA